MSARNQATNAPLPSPAASMASQHFNFPAAGQRLSPEQAAAEAQARAQQAQALQQAAAAKQRAPGGGDVSQYHNTMDSSSPFRNDFSLVAEAAKRAQMSVLMRDMGDVAL